MRGRTDLADECLDFAPGGIPSGISQEMLNSHGVPVKKVVVDEEAAARAIGKECGIYYTIETADFKSAGAEFADEVEATADLIRSLCPREKEKCVLVVGLGNRGITPDALGPQAVASILATRHLSGELAAQIGLPELAPVAAIAAGVLGQTGIETAEIVRSIAGELTPSAVIVIDALAANSVDRLARTVQVSNTGIHPGSGVQNRRKELSEQTLGVPVISIGVPMVVDLASVAEELGAGEFSDGMERVRGMMVTPREIDLAVEHAARTIAFGINRALQPSLTLEELTGLVG